MSQTTNLFKNPSAETNSTGFYTLPGTTGVAALTNPVTGGAPNAGTDFVRSTWSTASTAVGGGMAVGHNTNTGVERVDLVASTQYTASVWVRPSKAKTLTLSALVFNTTPAQVGSTVVGTAVAVLANTWTQLTVTHTSGVGGVRGVYQVKDTDATRWSIGDTLDSDAVTVTAGATAPIYGDPSSSLMWLWSGTAHASTSVLYTPSIVLNPYGGLAFTATDLPWCEVVITDVSPQVTALNVFRTAEDRQFQVRGGLAVPPGGGVSIPDSECPAILATYVAELLDVSGNRIQFTASASVTLGFTGTFIHQPLQPELYVCAGANGFRENAAKELVRPFDGELIYPEGAIVGVWVGSGRRGLSGVTLDVAVNGADQADLLQAVFGTYLNPQVGVVCIRTGEDVRIPRVLFAVFPNGPVEMEQNLAMGSGDLIFYGLSGTEVRPPAPALSQPALGYDDLDFFYSAGYDVMDAAYASYFDRDRDYSKAGVAP